MFIGMWWCAGVLIEACSVAAVAVLAHVACFLCGGQAKRSRWRSCWDWRHRHCSLGRCDLADGRGAEGVLGMAARGESGHAERGHRGSQFPRFWGGVFRQQSLVRATAQQRFARQLTQWAGVLGVAVIGLIGSLAQWSSARGHIRQPCRGFQAQLLLLAAWSLAMADAAGQAVDQGGTGGVRRAVGGVCWRFGFRTECNPWGFSGVCAHMKTAFLSLLNGAHHRLVCATGQRQCSGGPHRLCSIRRLV